MAMRIILGSSSPRRRELMGLLGYPFEVVYPGVDEIENGLKPIEVVKGIARTKRKAIQKEYKTDLVICADTIVVLDERILGKPKTKNDARRMISLLQDRTHEVLTAVECGKGKNIHSFVVKTKVSIAKMSSDEIEAYIETDEPYDKAGGYAIQGLFAKYVQKIDGDYYNVMGLPLAKLYQVLKKMME